ncbi:hypothetical protein KIL84_015350, partial [Mauremys mutica]
VNLDSCTWEVISHNVLKPTLMLRQGSEKNLHPHGEGFLLPVGWLAGARPPPGRQGARPPHSL